MITIISVVMISVVGYKYYAMKKEFVPAEVNKPVLEYINNNPETLFLMNSSAKDVIELSRKSIFTKASSETNIQTVGGWMLYHKDYYEKLNNKVSNPDRLIVAMTKDKKILFVDGKTDNNNYKRMQKFIFEHTGKKMTRRIEKDFKGLDIAIYRFDYK